MQIHLLIFLTFTAGCFSCSPLEYYLSTYCGGSSFVVAYLCRRYFLGFIIIFFKCNPDFEQKWAFLTSLMDFGPYSKPKVESWSWLPKYHIGNEKTAPDNEFVLNLLFIKFITIFIM